MEVDSLPVSVVQVDCVENRDLCAEQKVQAFPLLRMFKKGEPQSPDYRSDRTVDAFVEYVSSQLAQDEQLSLMKPEERKAHLDRKAQGKLRLSLAPRDITFLISPRTILPVINTAESNDHPGCMLSGFLLVNRVPGNFHLEMRSKHHNINPSAANLSHIVRNLRIVFYVLFVDFNLIFKSFLFCAALYLH